MNIKEHLLITLAEECAEVQQAISKALRFGADDGYPGKNTTNAQDIEDEFMEAMAVRDLLKNHGVLSHTDKSPEIYNNKQKRVMEFIEYAKSQGTIK